MSFIKREENIKAYTYMSNNSCMDGEEKQEDRHISTAAYNYFSDVIVPSSGNHGSNHLSQSFEPAPEIYSNLASAVEMIGFPPSSSSSKSATNDPTSSTYQDHHQLYDPTLSAMAFSWNNDGSNNNTNENHSSMVLDGVFPCAEERPSQGLSLSLSSSNPSSFVLQSFELKAQNDDGLRFGPSSSASRPPAVNSTQNHHHHHHHHQSSSELLQVQFLIRNSQYLGPVQELLNEFCSLGGTDKQTDVRTKKNSSSELPGEDGSSGNYKKDSLCSSIDLMELQRRKIKLFQMLEELDRRYKHYRDQMKAVESSFEAVAGKGSAAIYSASASKAMSRHFRCLRDGILSQIKATKKAMGDKDSASPGTVRGETPRLRILDQTLRQQKAIQQMNMMEAHPWRPQRGLPEKSVSILRAWLFEHFLHPYPSDVDKHILARQTGLSRSQVSNWFINARVRLWKPMVEEMYLQELKEQENDGPIIGSSSSTNYSENQQSPRIEDRKPTASIINYNNQAKNKKVLDERILDHHHHQIHDDEEPYISFARVGDHHHHQNSYGDHNSTMELDFSSYGVGGGGSGVSLTLGLRHQNAVTSGGGHMGSSSLGFISSSSSAHQSSLFYDSNQQSAPPEYSLFDGGDQGQTAAALPYRNLMGAQLLRDLAGG